MYWCCVPTKTLNIAHEETSTEQDIRDPLPRTQHHTHTQTEDIRVWKKKASMTYLKKVYNLPVHYYVDEKYFWATQAHCK